MKDLVQRLTLTLLLTLFGFGGHAEATDWEFPESWQLRHEIPGDAASEKPLYEESWEIYQKPTAPAGVNGIIWLRNRLPSSIDSHSVLFFPNGLEDLQVFINGELRYSFGRFDRSWNHVSTQRWHRLPLTAADAGQRVEYRLRFAYSYMLKALYPSVIRDTTLESIVLPRALLVLFAAGSYLTLSFAAGLTAFLRRRWDNFANYTMITAASGLWLLANQDSTVKPFIDLPNEFWTMLDVNSLIHGVTFTVIFFHTVLGEHSRFSRASIVIHISILIAALLFSISGVVHPWFLIPLLQLSGPTACAYYTLQIALRARRLDRKAVLLAVGCLTMALSGIHDVLRYFPWFPKILVSAIPFGVLLLFISMAGVLAIQYFEERRKTQSERDQLLNEVQQLNRELGESLVKVESLVYEKTRDILSILNVTQQALFMIGGEDLAILPDYSKATEALLEAKSIAGCQLESLILDHCDLSAEQKSMIVCALRSALNETAISFDFNAHILPRELVLIRGEERVVCETSWDPIFNDRDEVEKYLVTIRDVSSIRKLEQESADKSRDLQIISEILAISPELFSNFLTTWRQMSMSLYERLPKLTESQGLSMIFGVYHTLKGNARSVGLTRVSSALHEHEEILAKALQSQVFPPRIIGTSMNLLHDLIEPYRYFFIERMHLGQRAEQVTLSLDDAEMMVEAIQKQQWVDLHHGILPKIYDQVWRNLEQLCAHILADSERLAQQLQKDPPLIQVECKGLYLPRYLGPLLENVLGHLLRNALDHSLEGPNERRLRGKQTQGCITIRSRPLDGTWILEMMDDGRGLNLIAIQERARTAGIAVPDDLSRDPDRCLALLCTAGFSTRQRVTEISGRGIGLDAVASQLAQEGLDFQMAFAGPKDKDGLIPCIFQIVFPTDCILVYDETDTAARHAAPAA